MTMRTLLGQSNQESKERVQVLREIRMVLVLLTAKRELVIFTVTFEVVTLL